MTAEDPGDGPGRGIGRLNGLDEDGAAQRLAACCASTVWVAQMLDARPYPAAQALLEHGARSLAELDWGSIRQALDAHPRIGSRVAAAGREADWSRLEQAGTAGSSEETRSALVEANRAYEERFGHVFLIFATGRTDTEMLAAARERVGHDEATERDIVRAELSKIVALRLKRLLE